MPKVSVVIPTYNRAGMLKRVVEALLIQSYQDFEIIIVDDGSTDETESIAKQISRRSSQELVYFKQGRGGAGAARNLGIRHGRGELVLFIDDDVLPAPSLLEEHVAAHQRHQGDNIAIVGPVAYAPELKVTPFMQWLIDYGPHFWHSREQDGAKLDYHCFCTANISLSRRFMLEKGVFDENMRPFFEDIELGYRLMREGLQIVLNKNALGYHLRNETLQGFCHRSELAGQSAKSFYAKWPQAASSTRKVTSRLWAALCRSLQTLVMSLIAPVLKGAVSWLDSRDCAVPSVVYVVMLGYYWQFGFRGGIKCIEKWQQSRKH